MPPHERPSKQEAFLALLREGWTSLHLDARRPGVIVPAHLRREAHLVLQYGHDLPIRIPDLEVDDYGVRATLSFSQTPHLTVVPWSSVYVVECTDGRGMLFHEDVPDDVSIIAARPSADRLPPEVVDEEMPREEVMGASGQSDLGAERLLHAVPSDGGPRVEPLAARRRRKPQLRLVK